MSSLKMKFLSPVAALLLCSNIYADEINYSIKSQSLKDAIEVISKKSKTPYIVNGTLLEGKTSKAVQNVIGTKNALNQILQDSGLEAIIEDGAIIIREKRVKNTSKNENDLGEVNILANTKDGSAENGYLVGDISGIGIWGSRSLQDTPYQMTVISSDLLENNMVNDFKDIFKKMPTIQDTETDFPTLRGYQSRYPILEGIKTFYSLSIDPIETERVEILNGASGFMYGSGNVGGAINYTLKKSTDEPIKNITVGNYGGSDYYTHLDIGGKFDEEGKFGYRLNALYEDGESYIENQSKSDKLISATFDYDISDDATIILNLMHREQEETLKASFSFSDNRPSAYDSTKLYAPDKPTVDEADRLMLKLNWDINDIFSTRLAYTYTTVERYIYEVYPSLQTDGFFKTSAFYRPPFDWVGKGVQAYLDADFDTANISHKLSIGVSQSFQERNIYENSLWDSEYGYSLVDLKNIKYDDINPGEKYKIHENKDTNILIGDDILFNDKWSALIGVNYSIIDEKLYSSDGSTTSDYDKSATTPNLSLIYKPFKELTTYVSYIEALEQGTIVGDSYTNAGEILPPLVSKQYEVGAKYSLNENFLISSALFKIENANQYSDDGTSTGTYVQDGLEVHQGIELSATGRVTENLTLMGGFTFMELSIEDSNNPDLEGKEPTGAASRLAKVFAEYDIPSIEGLTLTGGVNYTGKKYGNSTNTDIVPSFTTYDVGTRYKTKIDKYPTTFNVTISNLTDEDYWAASSTLGDPRNIAFSMKMEF
ncbi:TonB-dependent siderophore receptor [Halarcobacter mediterraneus]|uniref:TonB-dependent siderophore receptor n=1 Tax=Halarcobacter mediterraneus TaxID=2023153 RepID=A0A4Q1ARF9_9BACT|nr:TonB-dependent receptor [Halarcobacter mediterraneus]RXK12154.1 TonB-dependent siderophore receptor [Halarcobacter mediterraneus]